MRKSWRAAVLGLVVGVVGMCVGAASAAPLLELPADTPSLCVSGPAGAFTVPPDVAIPFDGGYAMPTITAEVAGLIVQYFGGVVYVGRVNGMILLIPPISDPAAVLDPGWQTYRVTEGACSKVTPSVTYVAVCKLLPRADGTTGLFQQITVADWNDPKGEYFDAPAANWVDGMGLTCDVPAGYEPAGYDVAWGGKPTPDNDAHGTRASGQNDIYPFYVKA